MVWNIWVRAIWIYVGCTVVYRFDLNWVDAVIFDKRVHDMYNWESMAGLGLEMNG